MDLIKQYQKQYKWRDWPTAYRLLPSLQGKTVLDLGCGIGQQAMDFARAGAKVIAVDSNLELLAYAREQLALAAPMSQEIKSEEGISFGNLFNLSGAKKNSAQKTAATLDINYLEGDITQLTALKLPPVDVIWSSFSAAYMPDLKSTLAHWLLHLKPGGLLALVEIDDLLGHAPMDERARQVIMNFYQHALAQQRYDFLAGRKLRGLLQELGMEVQLAQPLSDAELCFRGPAPSAIMDAWKARLSRLTSLHQFCAGDYDAFRRRFIAALLDEGHRSLATVQMVCGRLPLDSIH